MKIKKAVILAGGEGSRMAPASKIVAKEMLPVVDRPVLDFLVEDLISVGVTDILIVSNKNKICIQNYFNNSKVNFQYIYQDSPLGVANALMHAKQFVGSSPFFLLYGDVIFSAKRSSVAQLYDVFKSQKCNILGARKVKPSKISLYGALGFKEVKGVKFITRIVEKPLPSQAPSNMVIAGQYILFPEIFEEISKMGAGQLFTDALLGLAKNNNLAAVEIDGKCFDVGSKIGYVMATLHYAMLHPQIKREIKKFLYSFNKN